VKVPISMARRAPVSRATSVMNVPCSGPICILALSGKRRCVSSASEVSTWSVGLLCAIR